MTFDLMKSLRRVADDERVDFHARGTCEAAETEVERLRTDLRKLSDAYLRLRGLIPGAFKTPHAPSPEQVWDTTERALQAALTSTK